nr:MAG TPA: hypothetical protein [Caudoviricetes sp.]
MIWKRQCYKKQKHFADAGCFFSAKNHGLLDYGKM